MHFKEVLVATMLGLLVLGCDPVYRFKFTSFRPMSESLKGRQTVVKPETLNAMNSNVVGFPDARLTIAVIRDGITVEPTDGGNFCNSIGMGFKVINESESALTLDPAKVRALYTNRPANWILNAAQGRATVAQGLEVKPEEKKDGVYVIAPKSTARVRAGFGILGNERYFFEMELRRADNGQTYVYRFKGVPDYTGPSSPAAGSDKNSG